MQALIASSRFTQVVVLSRPGIRAARCRRPSTTFEPSVRAPTRSGFSDPIRSRGGEHVSSLFPFSRNLATRISELRHAARSRWAARSGPASCLVPRASRHKFPLARASPYGGSTKPSGAARSPSRPVWWRRAPAAPNRRHRCGDGRKEGTAEARPASQPIWEAKQLKRGEPRQPPRWPRLLWGAEAGQEGNSAGQPLQSRCDRAPVHGTRTQRPSCRPSSSASSCRRGRVRRRDPARDGYGFSYAVDGSGSGRTTTVSPTRATSSAGISARDACSRTASSLVA